MFIAQGALVRAARVRLLVLDLDGTLTSGETWFRPGHEQLKAFHERDRAGLQMAHDAGLRTALITTGELPAERRIADELRIRYCFQDTADKRRAFLSHEDVRRMAHFVTSARAGYGAVREVSDFILRSRRG